MDIEQEHQRLDAYYHASRMTVAEMIAVLQTLDPNAKLEVRRPDADCSSVYCADSVGRPVLVGYESDAQGHRVYVIRANQASYMFSDFLGEKEPDIINARSE